MTIKQTIIFLFTVVVLQLLYCELNASPIENSNNEISENQHITRFKRQEDMLFNGDEQYGSTGVSTNDDEPGILEKLANYAMQLLKKFVQWMNSEN